jgi:predicted membrane protein
LYNNRQQDYFVLKLKTMADLNSFERRHRPRRSGRERVTGGMLLLLAGGVLLAREMGVAFPDWLFTWPMILILVGLFMGIKLRFRNPGWIFPLLIGVIFLADEMTGINLKPYILPVAIIAAGLLFIFRPRGRRWQDCRGGQWNQEAESVTEADAGVPAAIADRSDFIDATAVFGGVKKIVLSKNFKGGDITNFMGGSEINLTQADFKGRIHIDATNVFGGTKLIVPPHWDVQSEVVAVFGGVDDKRRLNGVTLDPDKVVILDGTCLFGGIEINSY